MSDEVETTHIGIYVGGPDDLRKAEILKVKMPCGNEWALHPGDTIPVESIPCSCGSPRHWFYKVGNS